MRLGITEKITKLGSYQNGNYTVTIYDDGTKVRQNNETYFRAAFPESIDLKVSNRCNRGCPMCHECSTPDGDLADLNHPLFDSIRPFTELAIGGGNALEHPGLDDFLSYMKKKNVICNITVHWKHLMQNIPTIFDWANKGLIHGVGVSINEEVNDAVFQIVDQLPTAVIHTIAGIVTPELLKRYSGKNRKVLILGYKNYGRGKTYLSDEVRANVENFPSLEWLRKHFKIVSFDNLALEQLRIKEQMSQGAWESRYMGDDGQFTMYIDAVKMEYAPSSVSKRMPICYDSVDKLFKQVQKQEVDLWE